MNCPQSDLRTQDAYIESGTSMCCFLKHRGVRSVEKTAHHSRPSQHHTWPIDQDAQFNGFMHPRGPLRPNRTVTQPTVRWLEPPFWRVWLLGAAGGSKQPWPSDPYVQATPTLNPKQLDPWPSNSLKSGSSAMARMWHLKISAGWRHQLQVTPKSLVVSLSSIIVENVCSRHNA